MSGMKAVRKTAEGRHEGRSDSATKIGGIVTRAGLNKASNNTLNQSFCRASRFPSISRTRRSLQAATQTSVKTESAPRPRPSTEYSIDPSAFAAGSMVLAGRTLAKYGKDKQSRRGRPSGTRTAPEPCRRTGGMNSSEQEGADPGGLRIGGPIPASLSRKKN